MKITTLFICFIFIACTGQHKTKNAEAANDIGSGDITTYEAVDTANDFNTYLGEEAENLAPSETRLRFENFSLVIHGFKGYDIATAERTAQENEFGKRMYWGQFGGGSDLNQAILNDSEASDEDYIETLIVLKDTIHLSESLSGNQINNTLLQILPKDKNDRFEISYCYLTTLSEFDHNKSVNEYELYQLYENRFTKEELKKFNENYFIKKENTAFVSVNDSADFYFPLTLLKDYNDQAWYINGLMSKEFYQKELHRIKRKYDLNDTLVTFSGEGGSSYATLTKNNRIFGYDSYAYFIQLDRYNKGKPAEKKYIIIYISYGC